MIYSWRLRESWIDRLKKLNMGSSISRELDVFFSAGVECATEHSYNDARSKALRKIVKIVETYVKHKRNDF